MNPNLVSKIFPEAVKNVEKGLCPMCKLEIKGFKDELSKKEFSISGMCQKCQDKFFN